MIELRDRQIGMLVGLAIGDAMGAPIEFQPARVPQNFVRTYLTGGAHNVSLGEFTDDTSMALAMADAFIESEDFDAHLIMNNFLHWKNEGAYSPRGVMFDCGMTVGSALNKYEANNTDPFTGSTDPMSAGNGGLMRLAPAILAASTQGQAIKFARDTTRLTHGASEAIFYSELLALELWNAKASEEKQETKLPSDINRNDVMSGGYVKETYQAAWWAFETTNNFEDCIVAAINRGHDSDTTGAVAGMIAGCIYGYNAIPKWMCEGLQWHDKIIEIAEKLILVGCRNTPQQELRFISSQLNKIDNPVTGSIYELEGRRCFCISNWVSYGGGSGPLWAVEGHSAQLTLQHPRTGYIQGICVKVSEEPAGIYFKPGYNGWEDDRDEGDRSIKFLALQEIGRYDTNWW